MDWVRIILEPKRFETEIGYTEPTFMRLYPFNGKLYFDLADYIKSFLKRPQHPKTIINGQPIETNYQRVVVIIEAIVNNQVTQRFSVTKDFIFGGRENYGSNQTLLAGTVLKESQKIPIWNGYPISKYVLENSGRILFNNILTENEVENRFVIGCNPVYVRWLNTLGGYSFWLFEKWKLTKKTGKPTEVEARPTKYNLGNKPTWTLEVETKCERRYYRTMRSLAQSPEVVVYDLTGIAIDDFGANLYDGALQRTAVKYFEPVINLGNSIQTDNGKDVDEFSFNFDCVLTMKPELRW